MGGSVVFARWRQCATWAHWRHPANMIELVHPSAHQSPQPTQLLLPSAHPSAQPKRQIKRLSSFCTAHSRKFLYFTMGDPFPKIAPFHGGSEPPSNSWFLGSFWDHNPNSMTIDLAVFAQVTAQCPYTLLCVPLSPKIAPSGRPSNTWFLGPIRAHNPNGMSIGSAVFAQMPAECPYTLQWDAPFPPQNCS